MTPRQPGPTASEQFEALWTAHYANVYSYALRRLGDDAAACDTTADTFLVAWRRFDDAPDPPDAWLFGIARNVLANHHRGERRRVALKAKAIGAHVDIPLHDETETSDAVANAFNRLSTSDRDVLGLVAWEELKPREAARVLGITATAFSVRLHRARRRFRKNLGNAGHSRLDEDAHDSVSPTMRADPHRSRAAVR